ncbi:hypothetical protein MRB53_039877 [Persea americana]|nr:hypothetical protein MRB53_039877 [Persea americana]
MPQVIMRPGKRVLVLREDSGGKNVSRCFKTFRCPPLSRLASARALHGRRTRRASCRRPPAPLPARKGGNHSAAGIVVPDGSIPLVEALRPVNLLAETMMH